MPPREAGGALWPVAAGDRLRALPSRGAVLAQNRDRAAGGRPRLAVLSSDPSGAGLVAEWSGGSVFGRDDASWRLDADDRVTVAGGPGRPDGCTLFVQSSCPAGVPSVGIVSLDPGSRAFRLETVARGVVPPVGGNGPAWRLGRERQAARARAVRPRPGHGQCWCIVVPGTVRSASASRCCPTTPDAERC